MKKQSDSPFAGTSEEELEWLSTEGAAWVEEQRELHRQQGRELSATQRRTFGPFFDESLLTGARVTVVERMENPAFFSVFKERGQPLPMDFRDASGLALIDTILIARRALVGAQVPSQLLFHELVHLVQDQALGTSRYMREYVRGWAANGHRYRTIPLEEQAYDLAARFERSPDEVFSVEEAVRRRFDLPAD